MINSSEIIKDLREKLAKSEKENQVLREENEKLRKQLDDLTNKVDYLVKQLFGKKSEKIDPQQLLLALAGLDSEQTDQGEEPEPPPTPTASPKRKRKRKSKQKLPEHLPLEEVFIDPDEVKADPSAYRCIGQEEQEKLDVYPTRFVRKKIIRRKYVKITDRLVAPIIAPAPKCLFERSFATPSLLTHIIINKYVDHLPLYRQQQILKTRYGIDLNLKTMSGWVWGIANWLQLIYSELKKEILLSPYLQVDETVIKYIDPGRGYAPPGYLWVYHVNGTGVFFDWHASRASTCLDDVLDDYDGYIQTDGYQAYNAYNKRRVENGKTSLTQLACWAHTRRYFKEAEKESYFARWILRQIQLLYAIESKLRDQQSGPQQRMAVRCAESTMILNRIEKALNIFQSKFLPNSLTGKAIAYTLNLWDKLTIYTQDGMLEIDNNLVENAIRPTAVGKKNWLFFGAEGAGEQSAILFSILESCKKLGINQHEYLLDVLTHIPEMTNQQITNMTPARWLQQRKKMAV